MKKFVLSLLLTASLLFGGTLCGVNAEDDLFRYEVNFEDFSTTEKSTPGEVLYAFSTRLGDRHIQAMYAVNSSRVIRFPARTHGKNSGSENMQQAYKNEKFDDGLILDGPDNTICIEDGKFKVKRTWDYGDARYYAFRIFYSQDNMAPLITGSVRVKFDFCVEAGMDENAQIGKWMIFGKEFGADLFRVSIYGNKLYLSPGNDSELNKAEYLLIDDFTLGQSYTLDLTMNLDAAKVNVKVNDKDCGTRAMNPQQNQFGWIQFQNVKPSGVRYFNFSLDNVLFEQLPSPKVVSTNISDGAVAVELNAPELEYNLPLSEQSVNGLSLYAFDEKVSDAVFCLSEDKTKITLTSPLQYSTLYTVKSDATVMAENRLSATPYEFSFHTKHQPPRLTATESISFDKTELVAGETVTASAKFRNSTGNKEDVMLLLVLYSADNCMEQIETASLSVPGGEELMHRVSLVLPADVGGKILKAYAWNCDTNTQIVTASNRLN